MKKLTDGKPNFRIESLAGTVDGQEWVQLAAICATTGSMIGATQIGLIHTATPTLYNVYVQPSYRRNGIAAALVRAAIRWALHAGRPLYLQALPTNPAYALYTREGFEAVNVTSALHLMRYTKSE